MPNRALYPGREISNVAIPGIAKGIAEGTYEDEASIYTLREQSEEDKLFQVNNSVRTLLENLENKNLLMENENED
jgi:hypothetical protein